MGSTQGIGDKDHPVWPLVEKLGVYAMVMGVLVFLTSINSTNFDWAYNGEAGTIVGTGVAGLVGVIAHWYKNDMIDKQKQRDDDVLRDEVLQTLVDRLETYDTKTKVDLVDIERKLTESQVVRRRSRKS